MNPITTTGLLFKRFTADLKLAGFSPSWNDDGDFIDVFNDGSALMPNTVNLALDNSKITLDGYIALVPNKGARRIQRVFRDWEKGILPKLKTITSKTSIEEAQKLNQLAIKNLASFLIEMKENEVLYGTIESKEPTMLLCGEGGVIGQCISA